MRFRARDVAAATGGRLVGPDVGLEGASFDSRSVLPGQLFVPVVAARDGHDFIDDAFARGAHATLTSRSEAIAPGRTAIMVADTITALGDLATARRQTFSGRVVAITGSVGKTSTKDLLLAAAATSLRTSANERSFNNDQGLPTALLNAPDDAEVLILEMGMRGPGEIARLCAVARPDVGVVTRVAEAHSERLGGLAGVAAAKAELPIALPPAGWAVLNADDAYVRAMAGATDAEVVLVGEHRDADVRIADVRLDPFARASFALATPWGEVRVLLGVSGRQMVPNAAAALACVGVLGGDVELAAEALRDATLSSSRMELSTTAAGALILDDSYNANPTSMRAGLRALLHLDARRRFAVLGLMAEIGDPEREHRAIATEALDAGVTLVAVGTDLYGMRADGVEVVDEVRDVPAALGSLAGGDAVLVKGSRAAGLERVVAALLGR